jgi:ferrous iron transport protein B
VQGYVPAPYPTAWAATKLLEGDEEITQQMQALLPAERWERVHQELMAHEDAFLAVATGRYEWIGRLVRAAVVRPRVGKLA